MSDIFVSRLAARLDTEIAAALVAAGYLYPRQIRDASDKELRDALKAQGMSSGKATLDAIRSAYRPH